jgi:hypothetical protein
VTVGEWAAEACLLDAQVAPKCACPGRGAIEIFGKSGCLAGYAACSEDPLMRILRSMVALLGAFLFACGSSGGGAGGATSTGGSGGSAETTSTTASATATTTSSAPPLAPFQCGAMMCEGTEYCEMVLPGTISSGGSASPHYTCYKLPDACPAVPTCDCVKAVQTGCPMTWCMDDDAGHVTVTCPLS